MGEVGVVPPRFLANVDGGNGVLVPAPQKYCLYLESRKT
jgi:hypothetical protein